MVAPPSATAHSSSFSFLTREQVCASSAVEITSAISFDTLNQPVSGGLYDLRMGPVDPGIVCPTCNQLEGDCLGHPGHIELPVPCYNPLLLSTLHRVLQVKCFHCHGLRLERLSARYHAARIRLLGLGEFCAAAELEAAALTEESLDRASAIAAVAACTTKRSYAQARALRRDATNKYWQALKAATKCASCGATTRRVRKDGSTKFFIIEGGPRARERDRTLGLSANPKSARRVLLADDDESEDDEEEAESSKQEARFMDAGEVESQLELLWRSCGALLDVALGRSNSTVASTPSMFFVKVLSVPPPRFRPAQSVAGRQVEHPQNVVFGKIVTLSDRIRKTSEAPELVRQWILLQNEVNALMDSSKANQSDAAPGIKQLLERKEGLFRKHMMGKRVNFCARSVISPDNFLRSGEIGMPVMFAKGLSYPERVTAHNVEMLRRMVENGSEIWPGANYVDLDSSRHSRINLSHVPSREKRAAMAKRLFTTPGQVVGRHLLDGDAILVNRQPTLHKPGIMAHSAKIFENSDDQNLRLHYANCNAYNADFDGDEINLHVVQNELARAEARYIMDASEQYIGATNSTPIRGLIQDHVGAAVKVSCQDCLITREWFCHLAYEACRSIVGDGHSVNIRIAGIRPCILKPEVKYSGKQLLALVVAHITTKYADASKPKVLRRFSSKAKVSAKAVSQGCADQLEENVVLFQNGHFLRGIVDKASIGASSQGIVHAIFEIYGASASAALLDALSRLLTIYLRDLAGHTCGMNDLILTANAERARKRLIDQAEQVGLEAFDSFVRDTFGSEREFGTRNEAMSAVYSLPDGGKLLDTAMQAALAPVHSQVVKACLPNGLATAFPSNSFALMVTTGAKGSIVNQSQISCALGQQSLEGRRVPLMATGKSLPCFEPFDPSPRAGGLVLDRFLTGLRPPEYFFHCMAGREGLIDTAVKSVSWETPVVVIDAGQTRYTEIGRWIDAQMIQHKSSVRRYPDNRDLELLEVRKVCIPTTDRDGHISWGAVTAVTRHDPGDHLYTVCTRSGRSVTVTAGQSLLCWKRGHLEPTLSAKLGIGDLLPVTASLPEPPETNEFARQRCWCIDLKTRDDGRFIGHYLATGSADGLNVFLEDEPEVRLWFEARRIRYKAAQSCLTASSRPFSRFMASFCGNLPCNKFVPDGALTAPRDFVEGLLSAYLRGRKADIVTGSKRLVDGVALLCSRLGVFGGTMSSTGENYCLTIANDAAKLLHSGDSVAAQPLFETRHDVVLDPIVSIELISTRDHSKMYDMCVPSTLNFGLANGLHVRDTSRSGYLQRCLVKHLEDLVVAYDHTVRDADGSVIQFLYGDDGLDATKAAVLDSGNFDFFYQNLRKASDAEPNHVPAAVLLQRKAAYTGRIEPGARVLAQRPNSSSKKWSFATVVKMRSSIEKCDLAFDDGVIFTRLPMWTTGDEQSSRRPLIKAAAKLEDPVSSRFAPHVMGCVSDKVANGIKNADGNSRRIVYERYVRALAAPGEAVGPIAAQSVGEPSTQMTLNTFHLAGHGAGNVTLGIPRLREIIMTASTSIKTPLTVLPYSSRLSDPDAPKLLASRLNRVLLSELLDTELGVRGTERIVLDSTRHIARRYDVSLRLHRDNVIATRFGPSMVQDQCEPTRLADHLRDAVRKALVDKFTKEERAAAPVFAVAAKTEIAEQPLENRTAAMLEDMDGDDDEEDVEAEDRDAELVGAQAARHMSDYEDGAQEDEELDPDATAVVQQEVVPQPAKKAVTSWKRRLKIDAKGTREDDRVVLSVSCDVPASRPRVDVATLVESCSDATIVRAASAGVVKATAVDEHQVDGKKHGAILIQGRDFYALWAAADYSVDLDLLESNDIAAVLNVYGVEAARACIVREINAVFGVYGIAVGHRHLSLIADRMTFYGGFHPMNRAAMALNSSPYLQMSFETTTAFLTNAALAGETDHLESPSASIVIGQPPKIGTNTFDILVDLTPAKELRSQSNARKVYDQRFVT